MNATRTPSKPFPRLALIACIACSGCSMQRMAATQTVGMLEKALPAFERETDYDLAADAFPASLKTMEGFLASAPDNQALLLLLARSYAAYALVVLEDRMEQAEPGSAAAEHLRQRARETYLRAHRYGLRWMDQRLAGFSAAFKAGGDGLTTALVGCSREDVPGLFWTAMSLASALNVARDDVLLIAQNVKVRALLERAVALRGDYYFGGPHLALGALLGSGGPLAGGDAPAAQKHFARALELSKRRFLMVHQMYARTLAVQQQDRKLFETLLREVLDADLSIEPTQKLANVAAKRRARRLLTQIDTYF